MFRCQSVQQQPPFMTNIFGKTEVDILISLEGSNRAIHCDNFKTAMSLK
jgi:hypothetical protein